MSSHEPGKVTETKSFDDDLILGSATTTSTGSDERARANTLDTGSIPPAATTNRTGFVSSDDEDEFDEDVVDGSSDHPKVSSNTSVDTISVDTISSASEDESDGEEDGDEEIKLAKEMALAFAEHPTMTPEQIKAMVEEKLKNEKEEKKKKKKRSRLKKVGGKVLHGGKKATKGMVKVAKKATHHSSKKKNKDAATDDEIDPSAELTLTPKESKRKAALEKKEQKAAEKEQKAAEKKEAKEAKAAAKRKFAPAKGDDSSSIGGMDELGDQVRLTGIVWKRRSGLGKYSVSAAWERRRIVLKGNKLYYYKTLVDEADDEISDDGSHAAPAAVPATKSWLETATAKATAAVNSVSATASSALQDTMPATKSRGELDLVKEHASVAASQGHSGAPTPFALSIKEQGQTNWKFCFDSHAELMQWLAALTDVVVQASVDSYNTQILQANDPSVDKSLSFQGQLSEPPLLAHMGDARAGGHRLWVTGSYKVASADMAKRDLNALEEVPSSDEEEEFEESALLPRGAAAASSKGRGGQGQQHGASSIDPETMKHLALVFNLVVLLSRASTTSVDTFWYLITFSNIVFFALLTGRVSLGKKSVVSQTAVGVSTSSKVASVDAQVKETSTEKKRSVPAMVKTTSAKGGYVPTAGTSTMQIKNPTDLPVNKDGHVFAGWRVTDPGEMDVRSHGYLSTKKKVKSPGQLYDCVQVDIFEHPNRIPDMAGRVKLPKVDYGDGDIVKTWNAPDIFVISIALPTDPPKLYSSSDDGGGYTITLYFAMAKDTREILKRVTADGYDPKSEKIDDPQKSKVNAARLFDEWCRRAPTDDKFMSRFKVVPNAQNLKEIGMPSWISKYNGKPFLIKRPGQTGFLYRHPELSAMEFDISLHPFPYLAKQGICFMKDSYFKRVLVSFGFVIEGRSDDELPECLIGLMQLCYPDPIHAIQGEDFFAGRSARSH